MKSNLIIGFLQFFITFASIAQVTVSIESQSVQTGSIISVPVHFETNQALDILAFQFILNWDSDLLEYQSLSDFGLASLNQTSFGTPDLTARDNSLTVAWEDYPNVFSIGSSNQVFSINFLVKENFSTANTTEISFCTTCATEFYNQNITPLTVSHQNAQISAESLPIELVDFEANVYQNTKTLLSWTTATETNNSHFNIERSFDSKNWLTIGKVSGAGTSTEKQDYQFLDKKPVSGNNFYRLKQYDFNGNFKYSNIKIVSIQQEKNALSWNNPVSNKLFLQYGAVEVLDLNLEMYSTNGQLIERQNFHIQAGQNSLEWDMNHLASGLYWIKAIGNETTAFKIVKD